MPNSIHLIVSLSGNRAANSLVTHAAQIGVLVSIEAYDFVVVKHSTQQTPTRTLICDE